jgi:hypothetical protein
VGLWGIFITTRENLSKIWKMVKVSPQWPSRGGLGVVWWRLRDHCGAVHFGWPLIV